MSNIGKSGIPEFQSGSINGYRVSQMTVTRYEGGDLHALLKQLLAEKSTGRLTLNVSQGGIGSLEWSESKFLEIMDSEIWDLTSMVFRKSI